ncbi:ATP-binding protein [Streptomyces tagetis]|uniref:ATP-binding protein n=1 Tax=Streptomyces tagetis TaxID=2820809 RepID=A0A940XHN2_9ACTN|nr:ATP-binding protein [Streptomyces sp. RG38]MBQ0828589.1 ATP-binding protein [Streptomyces sp. RG38]
MRRPLSLDLLALPKAVPDVRRAVREHFGVPCADVQLCVGELLANVIRHVGEGTPVSVRVGSMGCGRARVEVTDREPHAWLVVRHAGVEEETGRGLLLLDSVALRWGVLPREGGKTVWCEVALGR